MTSRDERASFESFYRDVRDDLLLQTYALTGDLTASERAVRDALVVAWHHWRKVSRLDDPGGWVRPLAWSRAQRRHTARWWHRQRDIPAEVKATLDALGTITVEQRRALLLTVLTAQPLEDIAREVGLSRAALERELQLASAQFSLARNVASTSIRALVQAMRPEIASTRWPRPTILLRAGTARRRSHTTLGIAAVVAATVVSGSLVTDASGVTPDLSSRGVTALPRPEAPPRSATPTPPPAQLAPDMLLGPEELAAADPGQWTPVSTSRNTEGDGLNITCQQARYADPQGIGTLVRTLTAPVGVAKGATKREQQVAASTQRKVVQSVEVSQTVAAATSAYDLMRTWYGVCSVPGLQLLSTYDVTGVGDAAGLVALRSWTKPASTMIVGVARTGDITTTVSLTRPGTAAPDLKKGAAILGDALTALCELPGSGACVASPSTSQARALPIEAAPAMIGELDLPPVGDVAQPWAGTVASPPKTNDAATKCDNTDFSTPDFSDAQTRSFIIPTATRLPAEFGLTETVGSLPAPRARAFVDRIRTKLEGCPARELGTTVTQLESTDSQRRSRTVWSLRVEISDNRFIDYRMAIVRSGTSLAQLGFIAGPRADMTDGSFRTLVDRALQRLDALPDLPAS